MIFASASSSTPPDFLYILLPALVSLLVGVMSGGWAGYNGWRHLRIDEKTQRDEAEAQKLTTSNALFNDALALVNTLRDETTRLRTENQELRDKFSYLNRRLDTLESENRQLRTELEDARAALKSMTTTIAPALTASGSGVSPIPAPAPLPPSISSSGVAEQY